MRKQTQTWTVAELQERHSTVDFPEYQREPNVWSRSAKQRLIDSMRRDFDISSFYIYDNGDGSFDCIDGRQRIGAIMAFLNANPDDEDNGFALKHQNEIYIDTPTPFDVLDGMTFRQIEERGAQGDAVSSVARDFERQFRNYRLTVVLLAESRIPEEFNLQFARLNLGTIINSGEKLHAMVGAMRDVCFAEGGLGQHPFLDGVRIPTRRYAKEQVAAQILAQTFSRKQSGQLTRTRHFDLQRFFKEYSSITAEQQQWIDELKGTLDLLHVAFSGHDVLHNRAMTVSTVLLAAKLGLSSQAVATKYERFIEEFLCRLKWQISKGLDVDREYRYLTDFQRHVTQASVEKPAVAERERVLEEQFELWKDTGRLLGDVEYQRRTRSNPSEECRQALSSSGRS